MKAKVSKPSVVENPEGLNVPKSAVPSDCTTGLHVNRLDDDSGVPMSTNNSMPDLDALSAGLPDGWRAMWDASSKGIYYGNLHTMVGAASSSSYSLLTHLSSVCI